MADRFEDLIAWQKARGLAQSIYALTRAPGFQDCAIGDQLRRAAVSVMANLAEGFDRGTHREFLRSSR